MKEKKESEKIQLNNISDALVNIYDETKIARLLVEELKAENSCQNKWILFFVLVSLFSPFVAMLLNNLYGVFQ